MRKLLAALLLCASCGFVSAEQSYNLGKTPWKFTKVTAGNENLARLATVTVGGEITAILTDRNDDSRIDVNGEPITIDMLFDKGKCQLQVKFAGDSVASVSGSVRLSNDGQNWIALGSVDRYTTSPIYKNDITDVNGTVGYTRTQVASVVEFPFDGWRYLELTPEVCFGSDGRQIAGKIGEVEVVSLAPKPSDAVMSAATLDDSEWESVGIPHCYNEYDSYLNTTKGELCWRGETWYRRTLFIPKDYRGKRLTMLFHGVNIGMTLFVNGKPAIGNTAVPQPGPVTHVGSSIPFEVDITDLVEYGADNQIAIKTSNRKETFFTYPGFAENEGFGQAMGGIVADVYLNVRDAVHIPSNCYSPQNKWGTYFGTLRADSKSATLRLQTNVENSSAKRQKVTLTTRVIDRDGNVVWQRPDTRTIEAGETSLFDYEAIIENPNLWYPIGTSGTPYLYTIESTVKAGRRVVDTHVETFGIRTITWDDDYCYVNGERCILRGFGNRNIYPGLGAALPEWVQWQNINDIAACGGNVLRVGHQSPYMTVYDACDALGVLLIVNSGDNEWTLRDEPALTYKREYDRDLIVAYRNRACVAVWESNNGLAYEGEKYWPSYTQEIVERWDYIQPRLVMNRDGYPDRWDPSKQIVIGYTNRYEKQKGHPSLNTEVYGTNWSGNPSWCIARFDYDNEVAFSDFYVRNYLDDLSNRACGWIDWMLAETYGEGYTIYLNGMRNQKSLGSCAMDANRFPKLKYRIYKNALWVPYEQRPGVALQSIWNFDEGSVQNIDAWSNCPQVELFIDGKSQGIRRPHDATRRCTWEAISWRPARVEAVGLDNEGREVCREAIETAGEPYAIEVEMFEPTPRADGSEFCLTADGSDAFVITARVVDRQGRWCPRSDAMLHFDVNGEAVYKGSYNFYVAKGHDYYYHAPGDHELQAEGGLMRVACRTTFTPGDITITVSSPGLQSGSCTLCSNPISEALPRK